MLLLRVPLQGVGLGTGVALQTLGAATGLADDLVGLGTGLGDRLVGGLLGQREHTRGAVAAGTLTGAAHRTTHGAAHRATHLLLHGRLTTHGTLAHLTLAHLALAHLTLTHLALAHLRLHLALTHGALAHRPLTHRAGTLLPLATRAGGQLRRTARQLGRATHGAPHLLRRARYPSGYGSAGTPHTLLLHALLILLGRLAHVLLVLGSSARGRGQFGPQVLILTEQARQFGFDLVEEGIDLVLVIAFSEADGRELLVPHVLGGQRHLFTST
ncbi:hypothetical protein STRIP9103_02271 [Streptomyces ipomoeae 91-03]|uniref:Uncharacterized protein n=1 Tax=Streptomyces ipomoeae 91-03 TaxID=698759 RepID=L1KV35_9ACTN|nr:hypothetical protein STRIP9103_02271 [Streptomyces ipomoeae 91-03]